MMEGENPEGTEEGMGTPAETPVEAPMGTPEETGAPTESEEGTM